MNYDYLVVGAGLYGCVFAHEAAKTGKKCLVIDKRDAIAGNVHTSETMGIQVHDYGAHIFIHLMKRYGSMFRSLPISITISILQWLFIRMSFITFLLT